MTTITRTDMRSEALRLAELGLRVLPLKGKHPITKHAVHDATSSPLQIESWWETYPEANIGVAGGRGIAIIDVDNRGGRDGISNLKSLTKGKPWPQTVCAKSGGGGFHFYFGVTKDMGNLGNAKDKLGKGIELVYEGKYVVAPPSTHPNTKRPYEWLHDPFESPCAPLPRWVLELQASSNAGRSSWDMDKYTDEIKEGEGRNNFLTSYAGALRRNGATIGEIYDALVARNNRVCSPPLSEHELKSIARSVSRYEPEDVMVTADFTDMGNAERFASYAKGSTIYVPGLEWFTWSGRRWRPDEGQVQEVAKRVVREIDNASKDLKALSKEDDDWADKRSKALWKWMQTSSNMHRITNMLKSASSHPDIYTDSGKLDQGRYSLNLVNGVFDLKTAELREHKANEFLTRLSRASYDPEAECPRWEAFLRDILPEPEVLAYVQRAIGYSLSGETREQCFFLMYGTGSNGKSTFIETIRYLLGNYAIKVDTSTIMGGYRASGAATPDLVRLRGPRFAVAAESSDGSHLNEAVIKDLTGEDMITARDLYQSPIEFTPQLKLWVYSNYKPTVKGMDRGIWRRIRLIPFTAVIEKPNKNMRIELRTELAGIFNWAYRGYQEWERYGLAEPKAIEEEIKSYRAMMDMVAEFIIEKCKRDEEYLKGKVGDTQVRESLSELWEKFSTWQSDLPRDERLGRNRFYERLREMGYTRRKLRIGGSRWTVPAVKGLKLRQL